MLLLLLATGCGTTRHPRIAVTPDISAEYQPIDIHVRGLAAYQRVTLTLRSTDASGVPFVSHARFRADARGALDLAHAPAKSGSYTGTWRMGLVTSMEPVAPRTQAPYDFDRSARRFTVTVGSNGRTIAAASFKRSLTLTPLVVRRPTVSHDGFQGTFAAPKDAAHVPAALELGGSEGGPKGPATEQAANGIPVLFVGYFHAHGLPDDLKNIPLEYFRRALLWLRRQPEVDPNRITVMGTSYGSEAALLLGVHYPSLVHAVAAIVPSGVVTCAIPGAGRQAGRCLGSPWSLNGRPVPYTKQWGVTDPTDEPRAVIPVERIKGAVLLTCAGLDDEWPSCHYASAIVDRLRARHFRFHVALYRYPEAGHVGAQVDAPFWPGTLALDEFAPSDEHARERLWPRALAFLRRG